MFQLLFMSARMCVCNVYNMYVTVSLYTVKRKPVIGLRGCPQSL